MEQIINDIREGLNMLGYTTGAGTIRRIDRNHFRVFADGLNVGIWDTIKRTFVD